MIKLTFKSYLSLGILAELIILIFFYLISENLGDIFRMSARYSGRLYLFILFVSIILLFLLSKENLKLS